MNTSTKPIQPATPLPWHVGGATTGRFPAYPIRDRQEQYVAALDIHARGGSNRDAAYIVEACNEYPRLMSENAELVAALRELRRCEPMDDDAQELVSARTVTDALLAKLVEG